MYMNYVQNSLAIKTMAECIETKTLPNLFSGMKSEPNASPENKMVQLGGA